MRYPLINTLTGMKIDINRKTFALANKTGGVSGPIVKPIAVRMVYQVAQAVNIPIIGMGGISVQKMQSNSSLPEQAPYPWERPTSTILQ